MARVKRPGAAISGANISRGVAITAGAAVRAARRRRRLTLEALARRTGISRARLGEIELGNGGGAPLEVWFALAQALGIYLRFEFGRDPHADMADVGHLAIQELVLRVAASSWERMPEAASLSWGSGRSVDVRLVDRKQRRIVISECWNTFGDLGAAQRSSNAKVRDAEQLALALAGDGPLFQVGLFGSCATRAPIEL